MADATSLKVIAPKSAGPLKRLFGSLGIDGDGMFFEQEHVDPFIMCDHVNIEGGSVKPPFCAHPHTGTTVATVLVEGEDMRAWDNHGGFEKEVLSAGGVYVVCTGRGCVHDEGADPVVIERTNRRAPFGLPGGDRPGKKFRMFQLWFDAGHIHSEDELPQATTQVVRPDAVPLLSGGSMKLRLLVGRYGDARGVDLAPTVMHCALLPFSGPGRLQIPAGVNGFIFVMLRGAMVDGIAVPADHEVLLPPRSESYELTIDVNISAAAEGGQPEDAQADEALELLVCYGNPIGKPWCKLLGYGGALVASSEEKVRELMREYESNPRNFGVPTSKVPADGSRFGLQEGYKDPLDGRGENQRADPTAAPPVARWYVLDEGPYQPKGKGKGAQKSTGDNSSKSS